MLVQIHAGPGLGRRAKAHRLSTAHLRRTAQVLHAPSIVTAAYWDCRPGTGRLL